MERVAKKRKTGAFDQDLLEELVKKYPKKEYRMGSAGNVLRKTGKKWVAVCKHNICLSLCSHAECGGGSALCKHKKHRARCADPECGGGSALCKHKRQRQDCRDPECGGGQAYCKHKKKRSNCSDPECGGGGGLCKHKKSRSRCFDPGCGGGGSYCKHMKKRSGCPDPECGGGGSLCNHKRYRSECPDPECGGGGALCKHKKKRSKCPDPECGGGGGLCQHKKPRSTCADPDCGGGGSYCKHNKIRAVCNDPDCGGGSAFCIICKTRYKQVGRFCATCHPDYIPSVTGASKIGCKFICDLSTNLGITIQHIHFDKKSKQTIGAEYVLPEYTKKKVDGFYIDSNGQKIVVEYLGDIYHGHPTLWGPDEDKRDSFGRLHKDNFECTERIFNKVASFGYIVRYVWESDYKKLKGLQSVESILREFKGKLEY